MWLLPAFSGLSRLMARTFYRLGTAGERVPATGPVLLVANHPNSLLDPALVVAAAGRPVRFLAKAPLFTDPRVGWLVRAVGSIPVYRRVDDPSAVGRNHEMFRAVHAALADGSAVGIFPEGTSHNEPSLAPLKTGAARIALGAAPVIGGAFPIVPVGLCYRNKDRFRSEALVLVGKPVVWDDLAAAAVADAGGGEEGGHRPVEPHGEAAACIGTATAATHAGPDPEAVRELMRRIDAALREHTVNLERWEDAPLVEWAQEIYVAEFEADEAPGAWAVRVREAAETLARLRRSGDASWTVVAHDVVRHGRLLESLGLRPGGLRLAPRATTAITWTLRQLSYFVVGAPLAALGMATFFVPYRLTGVIEAHSRPDVDRRSTYKALYGALLHLGWILGLGAAVGWALGWAVGLGLLFGLPVLGLVTLAIRERWADAKANARRFLLLRGRRSLHERLRARQREIAERLRKLREVAEVGDRGDLARGGAMEEIAVPAGHGSAADASTRSQTTAREAGGGLTTASSAVDMGKEPGRRVHG